MTDIRNLDTGQPEPLDPRRQDALDRIYGAQPASEEDWLPTNSDAEYDRLLEAVIGPEAVQAKHDARAQAEKAAASPLEGLIRDLPHVSRTVYSDADDADDMVMTDRGPRSKAWLIAEGVRLINEQQARQKAKDETFNKQIQYESPYPYPPGHVTQPPVDSVVHRARMGMLRAPNPDDARLVRENLATWAWIILGFIIVMSILSLIVDAIYRNT